MQTADDAYYVWLATLSCLTRQKGRSAKSHAMMQSDEKGRADDEGVFSSVVSGSDGGTGSSATELRRIFLAGNVWLHRLQCLFFGFSNFPSPGHTNEGYPLNVNLDDHWSCRQ